MGWGLVHAPIHLLSGGSPIKADHLMWHGVADGSSQRVDVWLGIQDNKYKHLQV